MQIPVSSQMKWKERYADEIARSVDEYEKKNKETEVKTRQLTPEEMTKIFGDNPEYGKEIRI